MSSLWRLLSWISIKFECSINFILNKFGYVSESYQDGCACIQISDPVCGDNGQTYINSGCLACEWVSYKEILIFYLICYPLKENPNVYSIQYTVKISSQLHWMVKGRCWVLSIYLALANQGFVWTVSNYVVILFDFDMFYSCSINILFKYTTSWCKIESRFNFGMCT